MPGRDPSDAEIAVELKNISESKVSEARRISKDPISLEAPFGEEKDSLYGEFVPDPKSISPDELIKENLSESGEITSLSLDPKNTNRINYILPLNIYNSRHILAHRH